MSYLNSQNSIEKCLGTINYYVEVSTTNCEFIFHRVLHLLRII